MTISRIVLLCDAVLLGVGLWVSRSNPATIEIRRDDEYAVTTSEDTSPDSSPTTEATASVQMTATSIATPTTTPDPRVVDVATITQFVQVPLEVVWSDTFDDVNSGWEPRYEMSKSPNDTRVPNYLKIPYNGYADDAYEFYVKPYSSNQPMLWDFNSNQTLPPYPYSILADVTAVRDTHVILFADYQGDFADVDQGTGIMLVVTLKEVETTLGDNFSDGRTPELAVYENRPGQLWDLKCQLAANTWPEIRSAVVALHVDRDTITVELAPSASSNQRVVQTCRRLAPLENNAPRYMGIGAVYTNPLELATVLDEQKVNREVISPAWVRFHTVAMAQRSASMPITMSLSEPEAMDGRGCRNLYRWKLITVRLSELYGTDTSMCDGGVLGDEGEPITILPYAPNAGELIGTWQCGNDEENRLTISCQGQFLQLATADLTRNLIYISNNWSTTGPPYMVIDSDDLAFGKRIWPTIQSWNVSARMGVLLMTYENEQLNSDWAGACRRVE